MTKKLKSGDNIRVNGELKQLQWNEDKQEFDLVDAPKEVKPLFVGGRMESWNCVRDMSCTFEANKVEVEYVFESSEKADRFTRSLELRQKAFNAMSADWGDERPDWEDANQRKCIVRLSRRHLRLETICHAHETLNFRTKEAAEKFRDSITVEDYLLIVGL